MVRALCGLRGRSAVVALTLSALLAVPLSTAAHDRSDDPLCAPQFSSGTTGPHQLSADHGTPRRAEHCVLCHAAQMVRAQQRTTHHAPHQVLVVAATARLQTHITAIFTSDRPARAPPRA